MNARDVVYASQDLRAWASALDVPASSMAGTTQAERARRASDLELAAAGTVDQAARIAVAVHATDPARATRIIESAREVVAAPEWDEALSGQLDDAERSTLYRRIHGLLTIMGDPLAVADVPPIAQRDDVPQRPRAQTAQVSEPEADEPSSEGTTAFGVVLTALFFGGLMLATRARR